MTYKLTFRKTFVAMATLLLTMPAMFGADYAKFHEYAGEVGSISVKTAAGTARKSLLSEKSNSLNTEKSGRII